MIGDGHAMRVAGQIMKHVLWSAKWSFGVNHPILPEEPSQKSVEGLLLGQRLEAPLSDSLFFRGGITQDLVRASDLIADACSKLDRNLTREEWSNFLGALPYRETCPQLNPAVQPKQK
jgi:hypothetical protein